MTKLQDELMKEPEAPLVREDYAKMQTIVLAVWNEAVEKDADPLTLAHALITQSIELMLLFHDAETVRTVCNRQTEILAAMRERMEANREH